ncbi:hypothetical protein DM806_09755 [Sphingobium lactosutens]|nr:hypothetical protein [Sphingobium lactosutens]
MPAVADDRIQLRDLMFKSLATGIGPIWPDSQRRRLAMQGHRSAGAARSDRNHSVVAHPVVNERARNLEEGVATRTSDFDVACIQAHGWTAYADGPSVWAATVGPPKIVAALKALAPQDGPAFAPASLFKVKAASGASLGRELTAMDAPATDPNCTAGQAKGRICALPELRPRHAGKGLSL